jgi:hypothetical protein
MGCYTWKRRKEFEFCLFKKKGSYEFFDQRLVESSEGKKGTSAPVVFMNLVMGMRQRSCIQWWMESAQPCLPSNPSEWF